MEILKNTDLIEKLNELHLIYVNDYDSLLSIKDDIFDIE
jgi:hypothetical protein